MSQPKRMTFTSREVGGGHTSKTEWVSLEDYELLKAEVERLTKAHSDALADFWAIHKGYFDLKAEVERLKEEYIDATNHYNKLHNDLQAEVERLRNAGDAMAMTLQVDYNGVPAITYWRAAKEGKPSV